MTKESAVLARWFPQSHSKVLYPYFLATPIPGVYRAQFHVVGLPIWFLVSRNDPIKELSKRGLDID